MLSSRYWLNILVVLTLLYSPIAVINPYWLNINRIPTGGDTASHVFYAYQFCQYFPKQGLTQWLPEVFSGLPFLSYYFPLPFIIIFILAQCLPFALAFKWATFLAAILLPVSVYALSNICFKLSRLAGFFAGISTLAFLLHEQNSIWGGNLLSILAGEFSYSYGMLFALLTLAIWIKALQGHYYWLLGAILEAATGFSHGYALLLVGFSSFFLLFCGNFKASLRFIIQVHSLAFFLLAGWLWPMLEMHNLTIPNDGAFLSSNWRDYWPKSLWPVYLGGIVSAITYGIPSIRKYWSKASQSALSFTAATFVLAITFWLNANRIGLADIRFFPYVWLLAALLSGWLFGEILTIARLHVANRYLMIGVHCVIVTSVLFMGSWLYQSTHKASQWSAWNHSGYEEKPTWQALKTLFPQLSGQLDSPRLVFEHAPINNDIGSTRALEALPMFLGQRPVLEGLYMESALLGPAIYYLQSEISQAPSSPLVRFPSASMDIPKAAQHMNLLHANELLIRSPEAYSALEQSPLFQKIAMAPPFTVYRLNNFTSQFIQTPSIPIRSIETKNWMEHAFNWFKRYPLVDSWPIYNAPGNLDVKQTSAPAIIKLLHFERERIVFTTNQPGAAHIVKMAYHPRWQLTGKGSLFMAAPGYMLIIPETSEVELIYSTTPIGFWGQLASILATVFIVLYLLWYFFTTYIQQNKAHNKQNKVIASNTLRNGLLIWLLLFTFLNIEAYYHNPERYYREGWQAMNQKNYQLAADNFDAIEGRRNSPAAQEEALFWAAKAHELAGNREQSKQRYQKLIESYNGYWLPESLFTLARLHRLDQQHALADQLETQLRSQYPQHRFTQALTVQ